LNNYNPGYFGDGSNAYTDHNVANTPFTIPPSTVPNIGNSLLAKGISWKYYGEGYSFANNPFPPDPRGLLYSYLANAFQYSKSIMTTSLKNNIEDIQPFFTDVQNDTLPAVSFVKPDSLIDAHPGTSTPPLAEAFIRKIVSAVQANPEVWKQAAIVVIFDEAGGYYDSGYIQHLDFLVMGRASR
jgi:phospholipase C